jgi:hypothetical protein
VLDAQVQEFQAAWLSHDRDSQAFAYGSFDRLSTSSTEWKDFFRLFTEDTVPSVYNIRFWTSKYEKILSQTSL